jgi:hypothetical protein
MVFQGIDKCIVDKPCQCQAPVILGIDLAKHEDFTVITSLCTKCFTVKDIWRFNQINWGEQKNMIKNVYIDSIMPQVIIDATGAGDVVYDDLVSMGMTVRPFKFSNSSKQAVINNLKLNIMGGKIKWPSQLKEAQMLKYELECYEVQQTKTGMTTYNAPLGCHDDCVISLALAANGLKSFIHPNIAADETVESFDTMSNIGWSDNDNGYDFGDNNSVFFG